MKHYFFVAILLFISLQHQNTQAKPKPKLTLLTGNWYQYDVDETFTLAMQCDGETINVQYANLSCSGSWNLIKGRKRKLILGPSLKPMELVFRLHLRN